ncbi:MAG: o-succinylbenzoate synthase [Chloroflexi bacterium]|nr:o-succinylbenzoate synthase [Chloroflexota bacterium]MCC6896383.1 o-succinylbenzoate synthase [Anaerolineae bacterium]
MKPIIVRSIKLYPIAMSLVETLKTSSGDEPFKTGVVARLETDDSVVGWGEASPEIAPGYNYETVGTALHIMSEFLIPALLGKTITSATEVPSLFSRVRGHHMAKHGLEAAVWDALAKTNGVSLAQAFAAYLPADHQSRGYANVGVSIGIKPTIEETLEVIEKRLGQGYGRIKLKIEPGWDVELARAVRKVYPNIVLMLDANSAYTLADADRLKQVDDLNLLMIEQPLGHDDIYEHSKLQPQLKTAICLDESICSADDLRLALDLGACRILNLKPARVSGYTESLEIYKICVAHNLPLWIGGLMETGIGRAANLAFASLPAVTLPCDISATDRYFDPDLTEPPFFLGANSRIAAPTAPGIGVEVVEERLEAAAQRWTSEQVYKNYF